MYSQAYASYMLQRSIIIIANYYLKHMITGISQVVVGDLVYCKDSLPEESTVIDSLEIESDAADAFLSDASSELQPEEKLPVVKVGNICLISCKSNAHILLVASGI